MHTEALVANADIGSLVPLAAEPRSRPAAATPLDLIEATYAEQAPRFLRVALAIVGDAAAAEDVVQDAFAQAVLKRDSFRGTGALEGWLWRIVVNRARSARRRSQLSAEIERRLGRSTDGSGSAEDDPGDLRAAVSRLPERQKLALFLRYYADLDYSSIATLLGVQPGTVGKLLSDARARIKETAEAMSDA